MRTTPALPPWTQTSPRLSLRSSHPTQRETERERECDRRGGWGGREGEGLQGETPDLQTDIDTSLISTCLEDV